jgi:3'(2'), 5'-bisphosphate nucleotidase
MKSIELNGRIQIAQKAAIDAGKSIMEIYDSGKFETEIKNNTSPVTKADKRAHEIITNCLNQTGLPILSEEGIKVNFIERKSWKYFWLVDPLDGTKEFISKNGEFTVNIALIKKNVPIAGVIYRPCTDTLYTGYAENAIYITEGEKSIEILPLKTRKTFNELLGNEGVRIVASRSHSSAETHSFIARFKEPEVMTMGSSLKFMLLLENKADIYPRFGTTMEWDTAAAHAILNASNRGVYETDLTAELTYNKSDLRNPFFIAF